MCGLFGYVGRRPPDPQLLTAAAVKAGRRGPHGHGWTGHRPGGRPALARHGLGPIRPVELVAGTRDTDRLVGHARLATFGWPEDPTGLQPIERNGHAVAHNGNVYNADPADPTDSTTLARVYARARETGQDPLTALAGTVEWAEQVAWAVLVLDRDGQLVAHRRHHPLWTVTDRHGGLYLSSQPIRPDAIAVPANRPVELTPGR